MSHYGTYEILDFCFNHSFETMYVWHEYHLFSVDLYMITIQQKLEDISGVSNCFAAYPFIRSANAAITGFEADSLFARFIGSCSIHAGT